MNKVLTVKEKATLSNGFLGLIWIVIGFLQVFKPNKIVTLLAIVFFLLGIISILLSIFVKTEQDDERSRHNKDRAKSDIYDILILAILICTLLVSFKGTWNIDLKRIMPFLLGGINIIQYILFIVYEKAGA
ncbi:hypothetical protein [Clostridium sp. C8-1-8]|uniref:hypothetical protein n=1 Tax=Clostridium sp. C8-1-8 TaxID=2698831 RepID=UPI00136C723B|nr:hypothetical protein [Clostridium sp. C8-1-8]